MTGPEAAKAGSERPKKQILFVDDEASILAGLRRSLRKQRDRWDMYFAESGAEALEHLDERHFDAVVSDMRMPRMDGAELLRRVRERSPGTVRIILSGYADVDASMRSASVSHQFVSKPCDSEVLTTVIERACGLECLLTDERLISVVGGIENLPVLPRVYTELCQALGAEEADLERIARIVGSDAAITAKILHLVNSSYFGLRTAVNDLKQAVAYLGTSTIRDLVVSYGIFSSASELTLAPSYDLEAETARAQWVGAFARTLLPRGVERDHAFLAGMMHGLGRLVVAANLADEYEEYARRLREGQDAKLEVGGFCPSALGAYLLGLWGMHYPILQAVAFYSRPRVCARGHELGVLGAVHVAEALAPGPSDRGACRLDREFLRTVASDEDIDAWQRAAASFQLRPYDAA